MTLREGGSTDAAGVEARPCGGGCRLWRSWDQVRLEREVSPSSVAGDPTPWIAEYRRGSQLALQRPHKVLAFGPDPEERAVLFIPPREGERGAERDRPVEVFIHGGYWQELSVWDSLFAAPAALRQGHGFAAVGYPLAPGRSILDMVAAVRAGVGAVAAALQQHGWSGPIHLVGHSAGAQLAATVVATPPAGVEVERLVAVSGVFDLEPLVGTSIDDALGLDATAVGELSPLRWDVTGGPATRVVIGEAETALFHCWSRCFAEQARRAGRAVEHVVVAGRHHFDVLFEAL